MYHGEKLIFSRDATGRATKVVAAGITFERRKIDGENGETFRVTPLKPVAELREAALAARPPQDDRERRSDLVDLATVDPGLRFDIRYATENNFLSTPFYTLPKAYMQRPAAESLGLAHRQLAKTGYGLLIHDAYRPWAVTKMFWDATPPHLRGFVANPMRGSRHNRGCAVDLTMYELATGQPVEMVGGYDEFSDRAYPTYPGGTSRQRWHRDHLRRAMEDHGFVAIDTEWWHFDHQDWSKYPILNKRFEELASGQP
jgi:serine beta-lactamase-like protein LACTB